MVPFPTFIRAACVFVLLCIVVVPSSLNALYASGSGSTGSATVGPADVTVTPDA